MAYDLAHYHFNPIKTGQIFKRLRMDKGMSLASAARRSGLTHDTIDNLERGRVQDVKFEILFKLCCVYAQPVEVVMLLMLKDDDVDFIDQVLLYNDKDGETFPVTDATSIPSSVPDTVVAAVEAVAAADAPISPDRKPVCSTEHVAYLQQHIDHLTRLLELAITQKGGQA